MSPLPERRPEPGGHKFGREAKGVGSDGGRCAKREHPLHARAQAGTRMPAIASLHLGSLWLGACVRSNRTQVPLHFAQMTIREIARRCKGELWGWAPVWGALFVAK